MDQPDEQIAIFGGGCFWCTEAIFQRLRGVKSVVSGYSGGATADPTYGQVASGTTGHAEVNKITFDPQVIGFETLLEIFFALHDPTTLDRQGSDIGNQYRSVIFYTSPEQRQAAENYIKKLTADKVFKRPIVTELLPIKEFYPADSYHTDYYDRNRDQPYCRLVISPKLRKLQEKYSGMLKISEMI